MDSADAAAWCEFCGEPFRKPSPAEPKLDAEKVLADPAKFLAAAEKPAVPVLPPYFRLLAWAFLGAWFLTGMMLAGILLARKRAAAPATGESQGVQIIGTP